jgi:hypothetical protein
MNHLRTTRITAIPKRALKPGVRGVEVVIGWGGGVDSGIGDGEERFEVERDVDGVEVIIGWGGWVDSGVGDDSGAFVGIAVGGVEGDVTGGVDVGWGVVVAPLLAPPPSLDGDDMTNTPSSVVPFTSVPYWSSHGQNGQVQ